ncbi:MAG: SufD family Fe-S cluster assembly protein, partial [Nitrospinota bacterium]|nr:SufD family Fe-S cluster assembly protein [Nitrospinota bacterium]
ELTAARFQLRQEPSNTSPEMVEKLIFPSAQNSMIVFVDGVYMEHLSNISSIRGQVDVRTLGQAFIQTPTLKDDVLNNSIAEKDPFANLNAAFVVNGAYLRVKDGESLKAPVEVLFLTAENNRVPLLASPRLYIEIGKGAKADIIFKQTKEFGPHFSDAVIDIKAMAGCEANLYNISLQKGPGWRFIKINVDQYAASKVKMIDVSTGAKISRLNLDWKLREAGAEMEIKSLASLEGSAQNHCLARVTHQAPDCSSQLLFKNIINDASRSSVDGTVVVEAGASGSFSRQLINNLLLSDDGRADNKPSLMIHADEVQCSHGATIGQLDDETLFYMMSRGLSRAEAAKALTNGFAREITGSITEPYVAAVVVEAILNRL